MTNHNAPITENQSLWQRAKERTGSFVRNNRTRVIGTVAALATAVPLFAGCATTNERGDALRNGTKATSETATQSPEDAALAKKEQEQQEILDMNASILNRSLLLSGKSDELDALRGDVFRASTTLDERLRYLDDVFQRDEMNKMINDEPDYYRERTNITPDSTPADLFSDYLTSSLILLTMTRIPDNKIRGLCGPSDEGDNTKALTSYTYLPDDLFDRELQTMLNISADSTEAQPMQAVCPSELVYFSHTFADTSYQFSDIEKTTATIENKTYPAYNYAFTVDGDSTTHTRTLAIVGYEGDNNKTEYRAVEVDF